MSFFPSQWVWSWHSCQRSFGYRCNSLFLDLFLSYPSGLHVCLISDWWCLISVHLYVRSRREALQMCSSYSKEAPDVICKFSDRVSISTKHSIGILIDCVESPDNLRNWIHYSNMFNCMKLPERVFDKKSQSKWEDRKPLRITVSLMAQTSKADTGRRMKVVGVSVIGRKTPKLRKK